MVEAIAEMSANHNGSLERALDHRLLRLAALELGHQLAHLLHERVDRRTVVAAHDDREAALADLVGAAALESGGSELACVEVGNWRYIPS